VQNVPRHQAILFRKYEWGLGQTGENNCSNTFAFNFFGRLNIFRDQKSGSLWGGGGGGELPNVPKNLGDGPINVTPSKIKNDKIKNKSAPMN
jgi:hypothetical protein